MKNEIESLLRAKDIDFAILIDRLSGAVIELGVEKKLKNKGLKMMWFDAPGALQRLEGFVEGQAAPKMIGQGTTHCVISWNRQNICGLFFDDNGAKVLENAAKAKRLSSRVSGAADA